MTSNQLFRDTARAMALGDNQRARELNAQISDDDRSDFFVFLAALAGGSLEHHFGEGRRPEHAEITSFIDQLRYEYRKADPPIKPLVIEAFVRAFYGEDHLLDDVSNDDQFLATFPIIRTIVDGSEHMKSNLDNYFDDADMLVREWTSEE